MRILVLNGGSSTLKGVLSNVPEPLPPHPPEPLWDAHVDWGRDPGTAEVRIKTSGGRVTRNRMPMRSPEAVFDAVIETLWTGPGKVLDSPDAIEVVGHRVVHGGRAFRDTTRITPEVKAEIARLVDFAPEHNHLELAAIEAAERVLGTRVPQVAVFDTAFHATLPPAAAVYAGPYCWHDEGIRRYGFHGISHQYTSQRAAEILGRDVKSLRIVTCHLGNGASLAAVREGRSIDTTMGFTPLEGIMMGSRSGSIDPGILIYLVRHRGYSADQLDHILNEDSGLKGVSGISGDMREVQAAMNAGNERARLAFDIYAHRLSREVGAMTASLGGLDALVFTAGIGENCAPLREVVCRQLEFLGISLDVEKNAQSPADEDVATADSAVRVLIVRTQEDWQIMRECYRLVKADLSDAVV